MSEIITCTAWDTAGKYSELIDESHKIVIGRNEYFSSRATPSLKTIRLERLLRRWRLIQTLLILAAADCMPQRSIIGKQKKALTQHSSLKSS